MTVFRRDGGTGSAAGISGLSTGMLCLGLVALAVASSLCIAFFVQLRKTKALRIRMVAEEKLAKIGKPTLRHAPQQVVNQSLDLSKMTMEMRQQIGQRPFRPLLPSQAHRQTTTQWTLPQSISSQSSSSGPMPSSSSENSNASRNTSSEAATSTTHHHLHTQSTLQRPQQSASQASQPAFAREKRVTRVAVPSALLRGLGDLPQLPAPGSGIPARPKRSLEEDASYTPVLGLDLEFDAVKGFASTKNSKDSTDKQTDTSTWFNNALTSAFDNSSNGSSRAKVYDLEAQQSTDATMRTMTGGAAPVTVDYFSLNNRRALAPARNELVKATPTTKHTSRPSQSGDVSPYKRPNIKLPPLPTNSMKKKSNNVKFSDQEEAFRPLSLGLSLKSSSKSSSLNAATMFGDLPGSFWNESVELPLGLPSFRKAKEEVVEQSSSNDSSVNIGSSEESRRYSEGSDAATSVDDMSNDAYDGASFMSKDPSVTNFKELQQQQQQQLPQTQPTAMEPKYVVPTLVHPGSALPFMTPHHRAIFPDRIDEEDDDEKRSSRAITPDLSQIHNAPLPPTSLPIVSPLLTPKASFASSFKAKAKSTLSRGKTTNISVLPATLMRQAIDPSAKNQSDNRSRTLSFASSSKSPALDTMVTLQGPTRNSRKVSTDALQHPAPLPALGLGLSDENGNVMDHEMATSSLGHGSNGIFTSSLLDNKAFQLPPLDVQSRLPQMANRTEVRETASSKLSQYSPASQFSPSVQQQGLRSLSRASRQDAMLGTPPMKLVTSPQFGVLSTRSPQFGQSPVMIGSDWALNRQQNHAHKPSIASSHCETISSCMTGGSDTFSMYDGGKAQDQRAKLLQTIQQSKVVNMDESGHNKEERGFFSHSARVSISSITSIVDRSATPVPAVKHVAPIKSSSSPASKKPTHLMLSIQGRENLQGSSSSNMAPLTPPYTPNNIEQQQTPVKMPITAVLESAAPLRDETPTLEQQTAAKMAKLRPLSLAVQHQNTSPSISRFKAGTSGNSSSSSWHRSQYSCQSSSSNTSTTTGPSASSSNTSLSQQAHASPSRLSFMATSPSRANFKSIKNGGAAPLGVLPTLPSDASPSFLTLTPRAAPNSNMSLLNWDLSTPSPRFSRASNNTINPVSCLPYHSPLSVDGFTSPLRVQRR